MDAAVLRVLRIMHQVGADAPVSAYLEHPGWPEAVRAARDAHVLLAANDGEDPDTPPRSLDVLPHHDADGRGGPQAVRLDGTCAPACGAGHGTLSVHERQPAAAVPAAAAPRRAVRPHALLPRQAGHRARRVELPLHDRLQHRGQPAVRRPRHGSVLHAGPLLGGRPGHRGQAARQLRRDRRLLPDGLADPPGRASGCGSC